VSTYDYDLAVIGTGPGGYHAAIYASKLGMRVIAFEKEAVGGTCLNVGCIPSKTLLHFSELYAEISKKKEYFGPSQSFNYHNMQQFKEEVVNGLRQSVTFLFQKNKITLVQSEAIIKGAHEIEAAGKIHTAKNIILAAGAETIQLPFLECDGKQVVSSSSFLALDAIPASLTVIGAGVIGVELASLFRRFGCKVDVVELTGHICPGLDGEIEKGLLQSLKAEGISFHLETQVVSATKQANKVTLLCKNDKEFSIESEMVLVAVGRRPSIKKMELEALGVLSEPTGHIQVNSQFQTSVSSLYAIGDLIQGPMLAHRASLEGVAVVEHLAGLKTGVEYMYVPGVIYTFPECAQVGLTEEEAQKLGRAYKSAKAYVRANPRAEACGYKDGFVKLIMDEKTKILLGMHLLCPQASELIAVGMIALKKKMTAEELADLPFAHPTLSEAIKEAALLLCKKAIHA
jgi:dihydrolipoamide dehydrogenase